MAYYGGGNNMPAGGSAFGGFAGGYSQSKEFPLVKKQYIIDTFSSDRYDS